jgi:PST family polysaccharide transporter
MSEKIFAQAFGLAVFAVQAPLLGPHAFGMLAAIMVFVGFLETVPGAAAIDALISLREIDELHYSTINLAMVILGIVIGLLLWGLAGPLAWWLGDVHLVPVMRIMAALPVIQALSIVPTAVAQRDMLFRPLTLRTIASQIAGGVVGLTAAIWGAGVWALVWQALVQRGVAALVLWSSVPSPFRLAFSLGHFREMTVFALPNMISRVMSWSSGQIPRLIIGVYLGTTGLGVFTFATRLNDVVTQIAILPKMIVARVDLRRFAGNPSLLGMAVSRVFGQVGLITYPLCIGGAAIMVPLVHSWLDPRWREAIVPAQILLVMCIPFITIYGSASLLLALNRQRSEAVICTMQSLATAFSVAMVAKHGVTVCAEAMVLVALLTVPLVVYAMRFGCQVSLRCIFSPQLPYLFASLFMAICVEFSRWTLETALGDRTMLPIAIIVGVLGYVAALAIMVPGQIGAVVDRVSHMVHSRP